MSFDLHKKFRQAIEPLRKENYTASHIAVIEVLAYKIDAKGFCFPSVQTIADESYIAVKTARTILRQLEVDGLVRTTFQTKKSSHYRLHIPDAFPGYVFSKRKDRWIRVNDSEPFGVAEGAVTGAAPVAKASSEAVEARLTSNSNQSLNPIREISTFPFLNKTDSPAESLLASTEVRTGDLSTQNEAPSPGVLQLRSLLMKKIKSGCPVPSARDVKLLTEAIESYGLSVMYQTIETVFKQKNHFWRNKIKAATYPCSSFCLSLPSIVKQHLEKEESRLRWAVERHSEESSRADREHGFGSTRYASETDIDESDFAVIDEADFD